MLTRFLRTSAVYFVGTVLSKVVGFLLLPVYTAMVSPSSFGEFDFWINLMTFAAPIAFLQVWDGTYRLHFGPNEDSVGVASTGTVLMLAGLLVYCGVVIPVLALLEAPYVWLTALYGVTLALQYFMGYLARAALRNPLFVVSGAMNTLTSAGTSVGLLFNGWGVAALYVGLIGGNVVQVGILAFYLRPDRVIRLSKAERALAKRLLAFSLPLCLASAAYWLLSGWSRFQVLHLSGADEVGLMAVGFRFGLVVAALTSVLVFAWNELLYLADRDTAGRQRLQEAGARVTVLAGLMGTAGVVLAAHFSFDALVADGYSQARDLVTPLVVATSLNSIATLLGSVFMAESENRPLLWSTLAASALNVVAGYWATVLWGAYGAAVVLALSFFLMVAWRVVSLRRRFGISVIGPSVAAPVLAVTIACILASTDPSPVTTAVMAATVVVLGGVALWQSVRELSPDRPDGSLR